MVRTAPRRRSWPQKPLARVVGRRVREAALKARAVNYTQGAYDFVDIISTNDPTAAVAFSAWYSAQGFGSITTLPAFSAEEFGQAIGKV